MKLKKFKFFHLRLLTYLVGLILCFVDIEYAKGINAQLLEAEKDLTTGISYGEHLCVNNGNIYIYGCIEKEVQDGYTTTVPVIWCNEVPTRVDYESLLNRWMDVMKIYNDTLYLIKDNIIIKYLLDGDITMKGTEELHSCFRHGYVYDFFIDSNGNKYVCGGTNSDMFVLMRNGKKLPLSVPLDENNEPLLSIGRVLEMYIDGNDIYACGFINGSVSASWKGNPIVWKNGEIVYFDNDLIVKSFMIKVYKGKPYGILRPINSNGDILMINNKIASKYSGRVIDFEVYNGNVYALGRKGDKIFFWTNDEKRDITEECGSKAYTMEIDNGWCYIGCTAKDKCPVYKLELK